MDAKEECCVAKEEGVGLEVDHRIAEDGLQRIFAEKITKHEREGWSLQWGE